MANNGVSKKIHNVWMILKFNYGLLFLFIGLVKVVNIISLWNKYSFLNVSSAGLDFAKYILLAFSLIEILLGILTLSKWTRIGAYAISIFLLLVSLNLLYIGNYFDIPLKLALAIGAFALAKLSEIK